MKIKVVILFAILLGFACSNNPKSSDATQTVTSIQAPDYQKMITARVFIKPGLEDEFIETAKMMIENSNKEEGCPGIYALPGSL